MTAALQVPRVYEFGQNSQTSGVIQKIYEKKDNESDIAYQSFAIFSANLSKCFLLESIAACLHTDLKKMFDFLLLRFSFYRNNSTISYTLTNIACSYEKGNISELWQQEMFFLLQTEDANNSGFETNEINLNEHAHKVHGLNFMFGDNSGIIVTIITDKNKLYMPVLKAVIENLYSKLLSLHIVEELTIKNNQQPTRLYISKL